MPADREHDGATQGHHVTHPTAGPSSAGAPAPPKPKPPRTIHRSANQLQRNHACLECRRRRIKCDAGRPHCGSCVRSYNFQQRTRGVAEMECVYEDEAEEGDGTDEIGRLEAKIAQLERQLNAESVTEPSAQPMPASSFDDWPTDLGVGEDNSGAAGVRFTAEPASLLDFGGDIHLGGDGSDGALGGSMDGFAFGQPEFPAVADRPEFPGVATVETVTTAMYGASMEAVPEPIEWEPVAPTGAVDMGDPTYGLGPGGGADGESGKLGGEFLDLIWPGWPPRLPTPGDVTTFFTTVPSVSRILHRQTFLARLRLPPTHADWPHLALLHAICACSARYTAAVYTLPPDETVRRAHDETAGRRARARGVTADDAAAAHVCFSDRHAAYAELETRLAECSGRRWVEIAQAQVLLAHWCQQQARWVDGWQLIGRSSRLVAPLGILSERTYRGRLLTAVVPPPTEPWDREERRRLMTYIMIGDSIVSASSGWSNAIQLDELMAHLPGSTEDFEQGFSIRENPQSWVSPDLYSSHPVVDSFVLMAKGIFLLARITKFVRRMHVLDDVNDVRSTDAFRRLDQDIVTYNLAFPAALRDPLKQLHGFKKGVDADLISAHAVSHVAAIALHEKYADLADRADASTMRLLAEARAVLGIIYLLSNTSIDFAQVLHPINSCAYFFAGARTFVLFYGHALRTGDFAQAASLLSDINMFQLAFSTLGNRFPIGIRHHGMLAQMLDALHDDLQHAPAAPHPSGLAVVASYDSPVSDGAAPSKGAPAPSFAKQVTEQAAFGAAHPQHPETVLYASRVADAMSFADVMDVRRGFQSRGEGGTPNSGETGSASGISPAQARSVSAG
ncbi:hypothetical protein Q5752_004790 [Cryptotrichosporon argae]